MCGIAGYFSPAKKLPDDIIRRMTSCIAHRGPDAEEFYVNELVAFGHRRLSIIDLSAAANQPMHSLDGRWVMMFNGEVFNFREISPELKITLRTHSDTEVMLEAFAKWGPSAVQKFNGMFTVALFDKHRQELYLFRDRLGVKPLYYFHENGNWFFASEIKSFNAVDELRGKLSVSKEAISQYLQLGYIPEPLTIWNEIKKFPAGFSLKISKGGSEWNCYWEAGEKISASVISDLTTAKKNLKSLLETSVQMRMISDVPFGVLLSGGIDSSLVAAIAQNQNSTPVKSFTIGFKESKYNEAHHAGKIAGYLKTDHHELIVTYNDALALCEESMDIFDEPFADSSAIPTMLVSKMARENVKMILSGDGGDETFMGYGMYRWAQRLSNPLTKTFRLPAARILSLFGSRYERASALFRYETEKDIAQHIFSQEQYFFSEKEATHLLGRNFKNGNIEFPDSSTRTLSAAEKQALFDLKFYLKDDLLVKVDRATMRYSLECRTPFLDYRIVEFALNTAQSLKMRGNELKILPRILLKDYLPQELFERPKWGFAIPIQKWLQSELRYLIDKYLSEEVITKHGWVNYEYVFELTQKFFAGKNYLYNRLWNLIVLHRWFEKHNPVN